jgi:MFS family permease
VLASGPYRLLWSAQFLSLAGDFFTYVAMAWLVLRLSGSGAVLGSVLALQAVPRAVLMLVGGAVSDRLSARTTMLVSATVRALLVGSLTVLVLLDAVQLWQLYVAALAIGIVSAFFLPARAAALPHTVSDDQLEAGNALLVMNNQAAIVIGPALAGVLVATAGSGPAFAVDAACFAASAVAVSRLPRQRSPGLDDGRSEHLLRQIGQGLRYAWSDTGIRAAILLIAAVDFCAIAAFDVGTPALAHQRFTQGAAALGAILSGWGVGSTLGALASGLIRAPRRFGLVVIATIAWIGASIGLIGLAPTLWLAVLAAAVGGVGTGVVNVYGMTWLQRRTSPDMLGRVMSLIMLASLGLTPIGLSLAGLVAQAHVTLLFLAAGAVILAAAAAASASRTVRQM